jgi:hypothetical protein
MTRPRWRIGAELLPVCLVLICLAGSMWLITAAYRHASARRQSEPLLSLVVQPPPIAPKPAPAPSQPPTPVEDPTPKILTRLASGTAEQTEAAAAADRRVESLDRARQVARAESDQWKRREMLIRDQISSLENRAQQIEAESEMIALERDVLARQREEKVDRQAKARERAKSSFAVLPYKGSNGSWQRPIPIECHNGTVTLQPNGPSYSLAELRMMLYYRSNPFIAAIAHELMRTQQASSPDGAPSVPYFLFVVRPDGIKAYHDARAVLEPLGIAFGYELVEEEQSIDYPDLDDLAEWEDADGKPAGSGEAPARWPTRPPGRLAIESGGMEGGVRPSPLQRALSGPENGYGSPLERTDRTLGSGSSASVSDSAGGSPAPNGRVEIVPRVGYGRRLSSVPPHPSRWTTPDQWGSGGKPPGSENFSLPDQGGSSPAGAGGRSDDPLPFPPVPPRSVIARGTDATAPSSPPEAESWPPRQSGATGLDGASASFAPRLPSTPPLPGLSPFLSAPGNGGAAESSSGKAESSSAVGDTGHGLGAGGGQGSVPRGRTFASDSPPSGSPSIGSSRAASPPTGAVSLPMLGMTPGRASGEIAEQPTRPTEEMSRLPERALEIVVVCGPKGVLIQPGGYRMSMANLRAGDGYLVKQLRSIVYQRQQADTKVFFEPRIRFLVEPGGELTYREVRKQTILSGTGWPVTLQVAEADQLHLLPREHW